MPERPILIIDDDPAIRTTVADILESEGYTVATAINGADGLQSLDRVDPALVLLDMRMPILDGWGFARALRSRGVQIPILVMTAAQDARRWAHEINARRLCRQTLRSDRSARRGRTILSGRLSISDLRNWRAAPLHSGIVVLVMCAVLPRYARENAPKIGAYHAAARKNAAVRCGTTLLRNSKSS